MEPIMHIILPRMPMGFILLLNRYTERMIITTCLTFPATFIMSGPPSFTALKFAMFRKKARIPWIRRRMSENVGADGSHVFQKGKSL